MGPTKAALIAVVALLLVSMDDAGAETCTAKTSSGSPFAICFDVGNRLFVHGGTGGLGGGLRLRHAIGFDDEPDLSWKLDHHVLEAMIGGLTNRFTGMVYSGRYLRHSRDGHIVLPLGRPRKIFLPFDIGAEAEAGRFRISRDSSQMELRVVRVAGLIDLSRTPSFRRRLSFGLAATWDTRIDMTKGRIEENLVAPLSLLTLSGYLESRDGLRWAEVQFDGGQEWSTLAGWQWQSSARVDLEQVILAINDHPLSIVLEARARFPDNELTALASARFGLMNADRTQQ